ncbi:uncharacterized protein LOC143072420 isoform X3 [Mytilus galloprovincialis]|uniref:uncharacterized protein LOC143072420 isoform X3 n=1 Tax=Mytilus galloprovincialis TaxID=29158 RepID=UPI003F7C5F45
MVHAILDKDNPTESLYAPVNANSEDTCTTITTVSEERASPDNISCDFQQNKNDEYQEEDAASCSTQESEEIKSNSPNQQVKKNRLNFYFRRQKIKTKKRAQNTIASQDAKSQNLKLAIKI